MVITYILYSFSSLVNKYVKILYIGGSGGSGGEVVGGGGWKAVRKHTLANSLAYVQQNKKQ